MAVIEVVKYNGGADTFAWRYPNEELGTWTQLIVNEAQEAVLVKGGKILDVFQSGKHTLDTENIPLLNSIINLPFGGRSPFTAEVWFINKAYNLDVKWGTPSPIQIQDPKYGVFVPVRSNGIFGIQVEEAKKFLIKLVGTIPLFDKSDITKYFRGLYVTKVKDSISSYLIHKQISILEINAYIDELSTYMKTRIEPTMKEYGISLASFYVNEISVPEEDEAVKKLKDALAKRAEMEILGYNYQQERSFDTLEGAAKNSGSGTAPMMSAGLGLGMGLGMATPFSQAFSGMAQEINTSTQAEKKKCIKCRTTVSGTQHFCGTCGLLLDDNQFDDVDHPKAACSACGAFITRNSKFCQDCGRKLSFCPQCDNDIPDDAESCPECGYQLPIICPNCSASVAAGKFCPECGHLLAKQCAKCNVIVEGNPKFCAECGQNLQEV